MFLCGVAPVTRVWILFWRGRCLTLLDLTRTVLCHLSICHLRDIATNLCVGLQRLCPHWGKHSLTWINCGNVWCWCFVIPFRPMWPWCPPSSAWKITTATSRRASTSWRRPISTASSSFCMRRRGCIEKVRVWLLWKRLTRTAFTPKVILENCCVVRKESASPHHNNLSHLPQIKLLC